MHSALGLDPITYRNNNIKIIVFNVIFLVIRRSSSEIPNYCFFIQFALFKNVLYVFADIWLGTLKQFNYIILI